MANTSRLKDIQMNILLKKIIGWTLQKQKYPKKYLENS